MKLLLPILILLAACQGIDSKLKPTAAVSMVRTDTILPADVAGNFSEPTALRFDSTELDKFLSAYPLFKAFKQDFLKFYGSRTYSFAWHNEKGLIEQSSILYNRILQSRDNGIEEDIPYVQEYTKMMEDSTEGLSATRELMLTGQYLNFARRAISGIPETEVQKLEWFIPRKKVDYAVLLDSLLAGNRGAVQSVLFPQYYLLADKLRHYREMEKKHSWIVIKADKSKYASGDSSPVIGDIRKRLFLAGDIPTDNGSLVFDSTLVAGVKEFQRRYGLKQDGVIGQGMIRELGAPLSKRMEQVLINMERCRWLPNETNEEYLMVNIPEFRLHAFVGGKETWSCNVVVGKSTNKTVIFRGDMKYVVFSPYWNVPQSIINKEILPAMKRNPNYLAKHNMEYNGGNIRQKPGPNNSLGLVKFLFPNSYNIYLHDTPSKSLFNEDKRAFSHGCIRVGEPFDLAKFLLRHDSNWNDQKIRAAMNAGKEQFVTLKQTVPVYLVYLTAFVDQHGKLNFREDIYGRDQKLKEMMFHKKS